MLILHDTIQNLVYRPLYRRYRLDTSKFHPRQKLVGDCLLARLLHVSLETVVSGKPFVHGRFGKPYLRDGSWWFNLTNSKDQVILVASRKEPVAVDTEKVRPVDYHRIHRAFTDSELNFLSRTPQDSLYRTTLKLWTVKEGVLKQIGTGLNGGARTVHVHLPDAKEAVRKGDRYRIIPYDVAPDYVGVIVKDL